MSAEKGYLDGRYMAATFNLLRGRDLIWNYVTNNYLMGEDYPPFDLLHWNGDTTNLPGQMAPGLSAATSTATTSWSSPAGSRSTARRSTSARSRPRPTSRPAARTISRPPHSVWKITHHFQGPLRFVLAGSGHIAGVVNPPEAQKYQYWTNDAKVDDARGVHRRRDRDQGQLVARLDRLDRRAGSATKVAAKGARVPGKGKLKAIEDAPGSYVKAR